VADALGSVVVTSTFDPAIIRVELVNLLICAQLGKRFDSCGFTRGKLVTAVYALATAAAATTKSLFRNERGIRKS
jgi:hypothetical protein